MKRIWIAIAVVAAVALVAAIVFFPRGHKGPEPLAFGRDTCARCRMTISQPGFGGEIRDHREAITKFDDAGCLIQAINASHQEIPEAFLDDQGGTGFVPLLTATFVKGSRIATPMGHGVIAFRDAATAANFAATNGGRVTPLETLLRDSALQANAPAVAVAEPFNEGDASKGRAVFMRECSACHGEHGDGVSPAAAFLDPKPRDFTRKNFRFHSTESGQPPRSSDIVATLNRGIPGSAMPSFAFLSDEEKRQAGAYVFQLAGFLDQPEPPAIDPGTPPPVTPASIARGRELFAKNGCNACHGDSGTGDGKQAAALKTAEGFPIRPRDFTKGIFKGGSERKDLFMRISTGLDGTPMPSFADGVEPVDRWALVDYVSSLKKPAVAEALPAGVLAAGHALVAKYQCRGCHVVDDGKGGQAGPDLRVSGQKLDPAFVRRFLTDPRGYGKVYPWRVSRMPDLKLSKDEVDAAAAWLAAMGMRDVTESPAIPDPATFPSAKLAAGQLTFTLRCAQCHALGELVKTPLASQQGPDLIHVAGRVDYAWAKDWITDPKKIDPNTKMANPGITADEVESVRMFVWKSSIEATQKKVATATP